MSMENKHIEFASHRFTDDGHFPNNDRLELVIYKQPFKDTSQILPDFIEKVFYSNSWINSWRNGLYTMHHYHSSAHEVLGLYSGWVVAQFGGPQGLALRVEAGDVIVVPAGVSHRNVEQSPDFQVIGAYPKGQSWDMNYGGADERLAAIPRIAQVPLPLNDPLFGKDGPLMKLWCGQNPKDS